MQTEPSNLWDEAFPDFQELYPIECSDAEKKDLFLFLANSFLRISVNHGNKNVNIVSGLQNLAEVYEKADGYDPRFVSGIDYILDYLALLLSGVEQSLAFGG